MSSDRAEASEREVRRVKDGDETDRTSGGGGVVAPWLEDHGLWSSSSSLSQMTPTRPSRISLLAAPAPEPLDAQRHVCHARAAAAAPAAVVSNAEEVTEARGSCAALHASREDTRDRDSPVAAPQGQQPALNAEDEWRRRASRPASSASSSSSSSAQAEAHPGRVVYEDGRGGGEEADDRSSELRHADANGASDDAEASPSTALHLPSSPQPRRQEASPLLPSLTPVATARTQQAMLSSSAKPPFTAAPRGLESDTPPPQVVSQGEGTNPTKRLCTAVAAASRRATLTTSPPSPSPEMWVSCAHSDLPARYRDVPGYYCTYCSYTVCVDCFPLTNLREQSRVTRTAAPSPAPSPAASASSVTGEMDWLDAVIASPATAVRSGGAANGAHQVHATAATYARESAGGDYGRTSRQRHLKEGASLRDAPPTSTSSTVAAPLRCHLCRRGDLVREEALLHEWCCEGPAPAARRHSGGSLVYDTANLHKYHFMRTQREKRRSSTEPLLARVLAVFPATLGGADARADGSAPCVTQSPLQSRRLRRPHGDASSGKSAVRGRDPLPSASSGHGRRLTLSRLDAGANAAASLRGSAALPNLDRCEEGGSYVFSVWNPRMEVQLVWCAVNYEAREGAPALHHHYQHSSAGHRGHGVLPSSASVTPLFMWRCPPSLPGLPARPFRVTVPYGLYAFASTHALALYEASDIFRKATTQLAAAAGGGDGAHHAQLHPRQLSSVKVVPAATLRALLIVHVMHHVATTPVPLRLGRALPPSLPDPTSQHHHLKEQRPVPQASSHVARCTTTPPSASRKRARMNEEDAEGGAEVSALPPTSDLQWPHGLASPELALCVDHLLHGRSVAVYGIGSKYYFLHHVAQSAELKHFHVVTVDASLGRGDGDVGNGDSIAAASAAGDPHGGGQRGRRSGGGSGTGASGGVAAAPSIVRQLIILGSTLVRRVHSTALKTELQLRRHDAMPPRRQARQQDMHQREQQRPGAAAEADAYPAARAALAGEEARSPAVARDVTSAMQRAVTASRTAITPVDVVDVDDALSSSGEEWDGMLGDLGKPCDSLRSAERVAVMPARDTVREVGRSPAARSTLATVTATTGMITPSKTTLKSRPRQRCPPSPTVLTSTPSSQRGTQLGGADASLSATPSLPLMSPVPAFFEVLQRTVTGSLENDGAAGADNDVAPTRSACVEMREWAGRLHSPKLPPLPATAASHRGGAASEVTWRAPVLCFASDAVRQLVLASVRRRQASRRCVQWVSLPSTTALAVLAEQIPFTAAPSPTAPPRLHLTEAHQLRPGWSPPVLLVLHNVDLLDTEEAGLLLQLCAEFAYPHPHLQLLLSFDDPRWPLTPLAGALTQMGVCAVQLRSLLLPRVHEMQHVSSLRLLTDSEAMAAGGAGSLGLKATGHGAPRAAGAGGLASAGSSSGAGGGSHLLQDTMRRVLFSLPPAFSGLLRILIDLQEEMGEGQRVSVFVAKDRFEQHGMMVSQGRLKALLQELTSNRIAQYDMAEHALTVMQPRKLRKVLEEVAAQRDGAAAAAAAPVSSGASAFRAS
ncbi:hypothetical protein, conserved [Leishmania donovani]|uniref:Uncharacterized protein n=1 Tax=Leishmania donovani TaxID=5661 RepID=E9B7D2_LEIDO|nr:hypothetical protein, conserved [Leishmania donovani]CBZ31155.1 hypothetical protein, conserved [Leishmania donovani]